jgi:EAL domain-containing protein (putative c-di-GMP-specific phosphodiesterase class I)
MQGVAAQIHLMGVSLTNGDLGVGDSSMRALAELPFDPLKGNPDIVGHGQVSHVQAWRAPS